MSWEDMVMAAASAVFGASVWLGVRRGDRASRWLAWPTAGALAMCAGAQWALGCPVTAAGSLLCGIGWAVLGRR